MTNSEKICFRGNSRLLYGFTLAEVLVTLGIIGVVAAMTMPTLMNNYQKQSYTTQLHKVYNEMLQAFERVKADSNAVTLNESRLRKNGNVWFLNNYFNTVKSCDLNNLTECFADKYKNIAGSEIRLRDSLGTGAECAVLASGAVVCVWRPLNSHYDVLTDVNGKSGPNTLGRDVFGFAVASNDINIFQPEPTGCAGNKTVDYGGCLSKIMEDGWKMDY